MQKVTVFDPTGSDKLGSVRGAGRYLQILKETFPEWNFIDSKDFTSFKDSVFINPFFNFLQKPITLKRIAKKQIAVIHDLIPLKYPSHFPAGLRGNINIYLNRLATGNYDLFLTDSEASKRDIVEILGISGEKIKVIYPCLPKTFKITYSKYKTPDTKYCLYVGDATWNKNLVNLAKALKIINVSCVFVGNVFNPSALKNSGSFTNKWQSEYKQFIFDTSGDKRFIFAGFIPDADLINLYQKAMLNILPSRDEGFGFSFLEAAQFSCPSVLADIPVLQETSNGAALFADPENPNDLADKIGELFFNNEKRNTLGSKAKTRSQYFSPEKFRKEFLSII